MSLENLSQTKTTSSNSALYTGEIAEESMSHCWTTPRATCSHSHQHVCTESGSFVCVFACVPIFGNYFRIDLYVSLWIVRIRSNVVCSRATTSWSHRERHHKIGGWPWWGMTSWAFPIPWTLDQEQSRKMLLNPLPAQRCTESPSKRTWAAITG